MQQVDLILTNAHVLTMDGPSPSLILEQWRSGRIQSLLWILPLQFQKILLPGKSSTAMEIF